MKIGISLILSLAIILGSISINACGGENSGIAWSNIPVYPKADLVITSGWYVLSEEERFSEIEWYYYEVTDKYNVNKVTSFYESEMLDNNWQKITGLETPGIIGTLWGYCYKINMYVPTDIAGTLHDWDYYNKNNEKDWVALWIGTDEEWEEADKTCIVIMIAR